MHRDDIPARLAERPLTRKPDRLTYGEDDSYRAIHCLTPQGLRETHEFHLEEGESAVIVPAESESSDSVLVLHESQLAPVLQLPGEALPKI